jgi:hypothetical protein
MPFIPEPKSKSDAVEKTGAVRMAHRTKIKCFLQVVNCQLEVFHLSKSVIPGLKTIGKVSDATKAVVMVCRTKTDGLLTIANRRFKVFHVCE